jgi:thiaminase
LNYLQELIIMAQESSSDSLTARLYASNSSALHSATYHPFLARAGDGTLPAPILCSWLVQDKYYQLAYVNFIGSLLAKLPMSSSAFTSPSGPKQTEEENLPWKTLDVLIHALTNIREEIDFYTKTVEGYGLPMDEVGEKEMNEVTRNYVKMFERVGDKEVSLLQGLVVLWATETVRYLLSGRDGLEDLILGCGLHVYCANWNVPLQVYLDAWTYASSQSKDSNEPSSGKGAAAALRKEFIPNWTCKPFRDFVNQIAEVTDAWAKNADAKEVEACKDSWLRVLELESKFWPDV